MERCALWRLVSVAGFGAALLAPLGAAAGAAGADGPPIGFDALLGFDQLPLLADWPAYQDSSYSRKNINADAGNFLRVEPNGDQVLTDTDGPGVVYRLWSTGVVGMQMSKDCRLRFYFDGEAAPRLDLSMSELFGAGGSQWPFVPPLSVTFESGRGGGEGPCNLCYVPIPFAKHLKIVGRNVMFYHVNYHKLPPGTQLESFSLELAQKHRKAIGEAAAQWAKVGQRPGTTKGQEFQQTGAFTLAPGASNQLRCKGEGMLSTLSVKLAQPTPKTLRSVVLEIAFEDEANACVRSPLGDFFGSGCGDRRFKSLPCGMTDEGYYSYWPMPFRKLAIVTLRNESPQPVQVQALKLGAFLGSQPAGAGYFHARYVENPDVPISEDYRILDLAGRGKFVGTNVTMQNTRGASGIFFLEGDEKIYVDGEKWPSRWLGTGTEDYFNGAYFWNAPDKAAMARPLGGLTFLDWGIGRVCAYRWHVLDFISFTKSIRVDLEHGGVSECPTRYASVAYYYLDKPTTQPPLPPLAQRLPRTPLPPAPKWLCCEPAAAPEIQGKPLAPTAISELDPEYETTDKVLCGRGRAGDEVSVPIKVPGEDTFKVVLFLSGGPDYATVGVSLDGKQLGEVKAQRPAFTPWFPTEFPGPVRLAGGEHKLTLKVGQASRLPAGRMPAPQLATPAEGADPADLAIALVAVQLRPSSRFINQWSVVGNWPCPKDGGWQQAHEPEKNQDLAAAYRLPQGREVRWREVKAEHVGLGGGDWQAAYGLTYVHSPDDRPVAIFITKDDGLKLWVNGEVAFDQNTWSHAWADQFHCTARLRKGWNKLLVKCANWGGAWAFALRLGDPDKALKFARSPDP
ncbi:MAG: DUF2961 domain-containing protein [Planctomycetes bacterium]|nr:DUF2961 domain-containing protein [Planctomycetota bacterium]